MKRVMPIIGRLLLKHSDVLVLFVVMGSWQALTGTPLTVRTELTLAGFFMVLNLLRAVRSVAEPAPAATGGEKDGREFVGDPQVVLEIAKLGGYEGLRRFTPYLGKWMTISGVYEGATESLCRDSIHVSILLSDQRRINLRFGQDWNEPLRLLRAGQKIAAICRIQHRDFAFVPENCELVVPILAKAS